MLDKSSLNRFKKMSYTDRASVRAGLTPEKIFCHICKKELKAEEAQGLEYVKTKRGTELFIHTACVSKW